MDLVDLGEYFKLSADLNYLLSAAPVAWNDCLTLIADGKPLAPRDRQVLLAVLPYLGDAYGRRARRLGSPALLHPLRSTALLVRAQGEPRVLDMLTEFLHDKREDLRLSDEMEARFVALLKQIDPQDEWFLMERLDWLTRRPDETYFLYVERLFDRAREAPAVIRAKLADRLDNVLDVRIAVSDPLPFQRFDEIVFALLFEPGYHGFALDEPHPPPSPLNGADRLYQVFKSTVVLSLLRRLSIPLDATADKLFRALATAAMHEAQRVVLHIWGYHEHAVRQQQESLRLIQEYAQSGGLDRVTAPSGHPLDGLFVRYFDDQDRDARAGKLRTLYGDKPLMVAAALAFVVILRRFLDDPGFYLTGISGGGLEVPS